jgi:hypothetical protein
MGAPAVRLDDSFVERVLEVVESIPPAHVMTYGDIAATLGSRAARVVGQVALAHYKAESTPLLASDADAGYRVNLRVARWRP